MNVLLISLQKFGGGAVDSLGLSNGFVENKFFHTILISKDNELIDKFKENEYRKVFIIDTYKSSYLNFLINTFLLFKFFKLIILLFKIKPKIIHITHFHPWVFFCLLFRKILKFKIFYTTHDNPFEPKENPVFFMNFLERFFIKKADLVITHSNYVKNGLEKYVKNKEIFFLPLGLYPKICDFEKKFNLEGKLKILFFGRIEEYKGIDVLVNAYEILKNKNLDIELIIAGRGIISEELKKKIKNLNIDLKNYWISNEELCKLLKESDVLVAPYKEGTQSGVIITALTYQIPIIASNVGANSEYIKDGVDGFLIPPNDYSKLAEAIEKVYNNRNLLIYFHNNLKNTANNFEWSNLTKKLITLYK